MPSFQDLEHMLSSIGWSLDKLVEPSGTIGKYVARISGPGDQKVTRDGDTAERALANAVMFAQRNNETRKFASMAKVASWSTPWREQQHEIARSYAAAPVYDAKAEQAWQALANESKLQADALRNQLSIKMTDDPHPYEDAADMLHDIHHKGNLVVSRAHSDHPIWTPDQVADFRIVHDAIGHANTGSDYSWPGEVRAVEHHMAHLSPTARRALFAETLGRTAYAMHHGSHGYGPQKIAMFEDHLGPVEQANGEQPIIPHGKVIYPVGMQSFSKTAQTVGEYIPPHNLTPMEYSTPRPGYDAIDPSPEYPNILPQTKLDPNHYYSTEPNAVAPITPAGHPDDYLNRAGVENNVAKYDQPEKPFETLSPEEQRKAIRNAFSVVILSPKKDLLWNAAHAQAISDLDSSATPGQMFDKLMQAKNYHNFNRVAPIPGKATNPDEFDLRDAAKLHHANYEKQLKYLQVYMQKTQGLSEGAAKEKAVDVLFSLFGQMEPYAMAALEKENEARQNAIDETTQEPMVNVRGKPKKLKKIDNNDMRLRIKTWEMVGLALRSMLGKSPNIRGLEKNVPMELPQGIQEHMGAEKLKATGDIRSRYGGAMYDHLEAIARMTPEVLETMRQYAMKDITEDGGRGFVFRAGCQALNISGIGPKTASFAWLLLKPQHSELGIIDTHAARALGYKDEEALTDATYHMFERQERTAKDTTGYADMPLAKYHWGLWDMARSPGHISDHSPLRPYNAQPWTDPDIDWGADKGATAADTPFFHGHPAWEKARPYLEATKQDWQAEFPNAGKGLPPSHYAQGLLPEQPPDQFRAPRVWTPTKRSELPEWMDENLNIKPEFYNPHEAPAAMSVAHASGWVPMEHGSPHGGPANTGDVVCPECNHRIIGPECRNCGHKVDGTEQPVIAGPYDPERADMREGGWHEAAGVDFARYVEDAEGDVAAAHNTLYHELINQGMDRQHAWTAANEYKANWESFNPTHHQLETYPERYQPGVEPRTFGEKPEYTDMSDFEPQQETNMDWAEQAMGNTPEQKYQAYPACPHCGSNALRRNQSSGKEFLECGVCKHQYTEDASGDGQLHDMGVPEGVEDTTPLSGPTESQFQTGDRVTHGPETGTVMGYERPGYPTVRFDAQNHPVFGEQGPKDIAHHPDNQYQLHAPMTAEPEGLNFPDAPPWSEQEQQYYRTHPGKPLSKWIETSLDIPKDQRCPGTWQMPKEKGPTGMDLCPVCGKQQFVGGANTRLPGAITPHRKTSAKQSTEEQIKMLAQKLGLGDTDYGDIWYDKSKGEVIFNSGDGGSIVDDFAGKDGNSDASANQRAESKLLTLFGTIPGVKKFTIEYEIAQPDGTEGVPYKQFTKGGATSWQEA